MNCSKAAGGAPFGYQFPVAHNEEEEVLTGLRLWPALYSFPAV